MTHKKLILSAAVLAVAGTVTAGNLAFAHNADEKHAHGVAVVERYKVDERKAQLMEKLETTKAERAEKLTAKRLENCQKRQATVNSIFKKATEQNKKQLAVIQKIEEKVEAFYTDKNLTVNGYTEAVANADEKEAAALAAVEASETVTFDCTTTDGAKPGNVIKTAMQARHTALKDYRTAVKDLILVVKKHNGQNRSTTEDSTNTETQTDTTTETETETETETTTGGQQ